MVKKIENLVFEGGGVLGIAYIGVLDYLHRNNLMRDLKMVAGTSAGAITACITSFQLPFNEIKLIADTLDYPKVLGKKDSFADADCIYRLINNYGWFSSEYFYEWIKSAIASQFDSSKKQSPYTFADFKNPTVHKRQQSFLDLYLIGTDVSNKIYRVFSFETTPDMEVAQAVRISMSIPLVFEAVRVDNSDSKNVTAPMTFIFSDGGIMNNYPLNLFDSPKYNAALINGVNMNTLGVRFKNKIKFNKIDNLIDFIWNMTHSFILAQQESYNSSPLDMVRSINIDTDDVSPIDFNLTTNDKTYNFLYNQGYEAAKIYFTDQFNPR